MTTPNSQSRSQPESFRARSLSVSLTAKNFEKSLAWYTAILGFTLDRKYEREGKVVGAAIKAGDVTISLNQDDGKKGTDRVVGQGFSMMFTTAQSVDEVAARIKAAGGTLDSDPADMPWGARIFRLTDPDGYKLVVSSERKQP
jgi:uncharacterized glyoxalase superfamily protein PhnB